MQMGWICHASSNIVPYNLDMKRGADPGFPWGGANTKGVTYYSAKFSWKLHGNEENLTEGQGRQKF